MAMIMLLEDETDRSDALIEATVDLSRLLGAEVCCLDRSASMCGAPVAHAIRQEGPGILDLEVRRCVICLERDAKACEPLLRQAAFIVSKSAPALKRAVAKGYGPVLLVPPGRDHCRLDGRALIVLDGSPSITRSLESLLGLLSAATAIEVITLRGAAHSDAELLVAKLGCHGIPGQTSVQISIGASNDADIHGECQRFRADWCLVGAERSCREPGIGAIAARSLAELSCPLIVAV